MKRSNAILVAAMALAGMAAAVLVVVGWTPDSLAPEAVQDPLRGVQESTAAGAGETDETNTPRSHAGEELEPGSEAGVRIQVRCAHTGVAVPEAELLDGGAGDRAEFEGQGSGAWHVTRWAPGRVVLVRAKGFAEREIGYPALQRLPIDELSGARVVELARLGLLRVRVEDLSGGPVQGAYVRVAPWDRQSQSEVTPLPRDWPVFQVPGFYREDSTGRAIRAGTDQSGELEVGHMPVGLQLIVYASGRVSDTRALVVVDPQTGLGEVTLRGETTFKIMGRVIQEDGVPGDGLMVRLLAPPWLDLHPERRTRSEGQYSIDGVPAGQYRILETITGKGVDVVVGGASVLEVEDIVIPVLGILDCTLTMGDEPAPVDAGESLFEGLGVQAILAGGERASVLPNSEGHFQLRAPRGAVTLLVTELFTGRILERVPASIPSGPCTIALDQRLAGIRLRLQGDGRPRAVEVVLIEGSIDEEGILPLFYGRGRPQPRRMQADAAGYVSLTGLHIGTYGLGIRDGPVGAWIPRLELGPGLLDLGEPELGVSALRATLETHDGATVADSEWLVRDLYRRQSDGRSDEDGELLLEALLPGPTLLLPRMRGAAEASGAVGVLLERGMQTSLVLRPPGSGIVRGRVTVGGLPLEGIAIRVQDAVAMDPVLSDASGRYELNPVLHGSQQLIFRDPPGRTERGMTEYRIVQVGAGEEVEQDVDFPASTGRVLRFRDGDEWVRDVEYVAVIGEHGNSARHIVPSSQGTLIWPGVEPLSMHAQALCVRRRTRGYSAGGFHQTVSFGATILEEDADSIVVGLATGRLEVIVADPARWNRLPQARVSAVAECSLDLVARTTTLPILMREVLESNRVVFLGIPVGAELELFAEDAEGRRVASHHSFRAPDRLIWGPAGLHSEPHPGESAK